MDGVRRLFGKRVEPVKAGDAEAITSPTPEETAERERIDAWINEMYRRNALTVDERMAEAQGYLDDGDVFMAYTMLTWFTWPDSSTELVAREHVAIELLQLALEHAGLLATRRAQ